MNLTRITELGDQLVVLRDEVSRLERELIREIHGVKSVFPTDFTKKKEAHEDKYGTQLDFSTLWSQQPKTHWSEV